MKITISVITAAYNQAKYLPDCINSVASSIFTPLTGIVVEHIVVNDGSSDKTDELCRKFSHLKYLYLANNQGASVARNQAIKVASGKYIFVLDSDDVILQRTLYHLYKSLQSPGAKWVYADFIRVDEQLKYLMGQDYFGWEFDNKRQRLKAIFSGQHFIQHNTMFTKSLFEQVGGYDENLRMAEDLDLYIRFIHQAGLPLYLPIVSHLHRLHDTNISRGYDQKRHLEDCKSLALKYNWKT